MNIQNNIYNYTIQINKQNQQISQVDNINSRQTSSYAYHAFLSNTIQKHIANKTAIGHSINNLASKVENNTLLAIKALHNSAKNTGSFDTHTMPNKQYNNYKHEPPVLVGLGETKPLSSGGDNTSSPDGGSNNTSSPDGGGDNTSSLDGGSNNTSSPGPAPAPTPAPAPASQLQFRTDLVTKDLNTIDYSKYTGVTDISWLGVNFDPDLIGDKSNDSPPCFQDPAVVTCPGWSGGSASMKDPVYGALGNSGIAWSYKPSWIQTCKESSYSYHYSKGDRIICEITLIKGFESSSLKNINNLDTKDVTSMSSTFSTFPIDRSSQKGFNEDINGWNVSKVTTMDNMLRTASVFDKDLNSWNVANVTDMSKIFYGAIKFNGAISKWNTSKVEDMSSMFYDANSFNQPIPTSGTKWNVKKVTDMESMFYNATKFNQPLVTWNIYNVTDVSYMFYGASVFNQDISKWRDAGGNFASNGVMKAQVYSIFENSGMSNYTPWTITRNMAYSPSVALSDNAVWGPYFVENFCKDSPVGKRLPKCGCGFRLSENNGTAPPFESECLPPDLRPAPAPEPTCKNAGIGAASPPCTSFKNKEECTGAHSPYTIKNGLPHYLCKWE